MTKFHIKKSWIENIIYLGVCIAVFFSVTYCFQPILVNGDSMNPTYNHHDFLIASKLSYKSDKPKRNDVVVVDANNKGLDMFIIKRVIGIPGDCIEVRKGNLYINNELIDEPYIQEKMIEDVPKMTVSENSIIIMGDNRNHSTDSRVLGEVSQEDVLGKVVFDKIRIAGHILDLFV